MAARATVGVWTILVVAAGCGGSVIISSEDGEDGEAPAGGVGSSPPGAPGGPGDPDDPEDPSEPDSDIDGWAPPPPGTCLTCSAWLDACGDTGLCPNPSALCDSELAKADALIVCVCTGCAELCGGNCAMFDQSEDSACRDCQKVVMQEPCQYERFACIGSPFP